VRGEFFRLQVRKDLEQTLHNFFVGGELSRRRLHAPSILLVLESQGRFPYVALDANDGFWIEAKQTAVEQVEGGLIERSGQGLLDDENCFGVAELGKSSGGAGGRRLTDQENVLFFLGLGVLFFLDLFLFLRAA